MLRCVLQPDPGVLFFEQLSSLLLNPLNPKIKINILLCRPYSFTIEVVGRS